MKRKYLIVCPLLTLLLAAPLAAQDIKDLEEEALKAAVEAVAPSVVKIETFGGLEKVGQVLIGEGPTTGLAVSEDGYILSSAFNFVQQPSSILVTLPSGKRAAAEIVARDNSRMLVLLKVNTDEKFTVPQSVPRGEMIVGQWAVAVGRTYDSVKPSQSAGVISATNRIWGKAIQTDAKIGPDNYGGPLVDIEGRVLGVLVPMSPQGQGEIAGAEWYHSGIGFAVPLAEIEPQLEKMKRGEDLSPGLLGISLKRGNQFAEPAVAAAVPARSPAAEAGMKAGDEIVEVDGKPIVRQAQLKHALGGKYAGDVVKVVYKRGDERTEVEIELVAKIEAYQHPFLGILPMRDVADVVMRHVYAGGPAEKAGIKEGDKLVELAGEKIEHAADLRDAVANLQPGEKVKLKIEQAGETKEVEAELWHAANRHPGSAAPPRLPTAPIRARASRRRESSRSRFPKRTTSALPTCRRTTTRRSRTDWSSGSPSRASSTRRRLLPAGRRSPRATR